MKFVLSEDEYVEAGLLHTQPAPRSLAIGFGAMAFFGFALGWSTRKDVADGVMMAITIAIGYAFALMTVRRWQLPRKLRALYRQHRALAAEMDLEWNDHGVTVTSPQGRGTEPWTHHRLMLEGPKVFVLRVTDALYHVIPKSALGSTDRVDSFRATALRSIGH